MRVSLWALAVVGASCAAPPPPASDDWSGFGDLEHVLRWTPEQQLRGYRNIDRIFPTRTIHARGTPSPLPRRAVDLDSLRYEVDGQTFDLPAFLAGNHVVGLLVMHGGAIVLERYARGNTADTRWYSFSVAKSVVSLLVGAALRDGYLASVDDRVTDYVPRLRGSAYEGVTVRQTLHMASGVAWREDYADPASDIAQVSGSALERLRYLGRRPRAALPGTAFNYNTEETNVLGAVLRAAIGNNLSTYLEHTIWGPFGMEHDATWVLLSEGGAEHGGCCLSATLRDYGRIGLFALGGGRLADGTPVVADGWIAASTTPSPTHPGYGYGWWLGPAATYEARGIYGQAIHLDPARGLVIVMHSIWPRATDRTRIAHREAFVAAVARAVDSRASRSRGE